MLKRVLLLAAVLLALGVSGAQASPLLTGPHARAAIRDWSLSHGMVDAQVTRCKRRSAVSIDCIEIETGWWNEAEGIWANRAQSWYEAKLGPPMRIAWLGFAWTPACTTTPGLSPQCPA